MGEGHTKHQRTLHILTIGDSLTAGHHQGGRAFHPYSIHLTRLFESAGISVKIDQRGCCGERVLPTMINRLRTILEKDSSYDWIIILAGINDLIFQGSAEKVFKEGLRPMYEMSLNHRGGKTKLAILSLMEFWSYKPGTESDRGRVLLNTMIRDYVTHSNQQDRICFVDLDRYIPFHCVTNEAERKAIWDDGLHLTPAGYDRMATLIFDAMKTKL